MLLLLLLLLLLFGLPILPPAQYGPYYISFWHGDGEQLGWFVFITIRNSNMWNHMCTVVLWTKIVVEFVSIQQVAAIKKQNVMLVALNASAC